MSIRALTLKKNAKSEFLDFKVFWAPLGPMGPVGPIGPIGPRIITDTPGALGVMKNYRWGPGGYQKLHPGPKTL